MVQPMNSCNGPLQSLSDCTEKPEESLSSLDPLFDAEGASLALGPMFSTGRCSLLAPFATV